MVSGQDKWIAFPDDRHVGAIRDGACPGRARSGSCRR
jgi:hypothetical protein